MMPFTQSENSRVERWRGVYWTNKRQLQQTSSNATSRSRGLQRLNTLPWAMSLPEEQELDWKRPMVSPVAVQRNQTVQATNIQNGSISSLKEMVWNSNKVRGGKPISRNIQKAKAFPENLLPKCHRLPVQRVSYSRTLLKIEWHSLWRWLSETIKPKKTSRSVDIVHRLLMGSKVKVIQMATRRRSGLTVQWVQ